MTFCNTKTKEWKADISFQSRRQRLPDGSYVADININGISAGFRVPFSEPSENSSCLQQADSHTSSSAVTAHNNSSSAAVT